MSDNQIRIAIAEACGWRPEDAKSGFRGSRDSDGRLWACESIPDYCNDLNAMHEAERTMLFSQRKKFVRELQKVIGRQFAPEAMVWPDACIHATARQRAEAFLRTIGKWEEAVK